MRPIVRWSSRNSSGEPLLTACQAVKSSMFIDHTSRPQLLPSIANLQWSDADLEVREAQAHSSIGCAKTAILYVDSREKARVL